MLPTGVKDVKSVNVSMTLAELGLDSLMGVEIKQLLERDYEVNLSAKEIRSLSVTQLQAIGMGNGLAKKQAVENKNVQVNSSHNSGQESNDNTAHNGSTKEKLTETKLVPSESLVLMTESHAYKGNPLFVIHPIEGTINMLQPLMKQLHMPVYGLQCTADTPMESVASMAAYYIQVYLKRCKKLSLLDNNNNNNFFLIYKLLNPLID